jgi:Pyruvate/2-oxoacid:ferredoxin oxidoreductase delta subunit
MEKEQPVIRGTFVSLWSCGSAIETPATLNPATGQVSAESSQIQPTGNLEKEEFIYPDGDSHEVCPECHEYILKPVLTETTGKQLVQAHTCKGCDYTTE